MVPNPNPNPNPNPLLRIELNGEKVVPPTAPPQYGNAAFSIRYAPGNLTAVGLSKTGQVLSTATKFTTGQAVSIRLSLDAPSVLTGTGRTLVANGEEHSDGDPNPNPNPNPNPDLRIQRW